VIERKNEPPPGFRDRVRPEDSEAVRELTAATGFFRDEEVAIAAELVQETLDRGEAAGYHYLFADDATGLAGYACYGAIPLTVASWDLYWIAVRPHGQRAGLGRRLVREVEARVLRAGGTQIFADTSGRAQYLPTRAFYERCGYVVAAELEDFYAPGDTKVVYVRRLGARDGRP
jgi:ribosomal protein S18 acetylase RimI-like enzyme